VARDEGRGLGTSGVRIAAVTSAPREDVVDVALEREVDRQVGGDRRQPGLVVEVEAAAERGDGDRAVDRAGVEQPIARRRASRRATVDCRRRPGRRW
jgi:hypothetical protein